MPDNKKYLSKIVKGGNTLYLKDAEARQDIADIKSSITGAMHWLGYTTSALVDGSTTNPIVISGENVTAKAGDVVAIQGSGSDAQSDKEFVFSGTKWQEYGSTGSLKALAFKDSATGSVTAAGSNAESTVTFASGAGSDFVTGFNDDAVAPSFSEGAFSQGTLPSFTEGAFTPASLGTGFYSAGTAPSFEEGTFSAGTLPSKEADTFSAGTLPSKEADTFTQGTLPTLGDATKSSFATAGETSVYDEESETLTFSDASTAQAVTAQGTFSQGTLPTFTEGAFTQGTLPSYTEGTFSAGTLPSKQADTFSAGTMAAIDVTKFDGGSKASDTFSAGTLPSKAADTFSAGSAATPTKAKALTATDTGTAAGQTFTGSAVSVTVS